jgi:hypothetical protein
MTRAYRSQGGDGWSYRFLADQLQGAPLDRLVSQREEQAHQSVHLLHLGLRRLSAQGARLSQDRRLPTGYASAIERIISCLVRYHGARHAASYGRTNADYQVV